MVPVAPPDEPTQFHLPLPVAGRLPARAPGRYASVLPHDVRSAAAVQSIVESRVDPHRQMHGNAPQP